MKKKSIPIILTVAAIVIIAVILFTSEKIEKTTAKNTNKTSVENTKPDEQKTDSESTKNDNQATNLDNTKITDQESESQNTEINDQDTDSESTKTPDQNANSQNNPVDVTENKEDDTSNEQPVPSIKEQVIDYILNDQDDKPAADRLNWSKSFLEQVDIDKLYDEYVADGGNADDIEEIAKYVTLNAPVSDNWEELFENDLSEAYGEKVSKLESLEDDLYQAYVNIDGEDVPYVVVSSRTGYFHG